MTARAWASWIADCDRRVADPEEDAHALRRREGHVEARDRAARAQDLAGDGAVAGEDGVQRVVLHAPVEPERPRAAAEPAPGGLGPAEVVVLDAGGQRPGRRDRTAGLVEVVAGLSGRELADGDHRQ